MEGVNGDTEVDRGGPPVLSPLTGCYLLIVIGEPHCQDHKDIILKRIEKGLLSWDFNDCHVDLEKELSIITEQSPEGEEAKYGERLIQFASENLVTEVLIHPAVSTLSQCMKNLLSSFTRHRHIIHSGYTFAGNGSWILQDGTFSLADFSEAFQEVEVQRVLKAYENTISLDLHCSLEGDWSKLPRELFTKNCKLRLNPDDVLTSGNTSITNFLNYLLPFLNPTDIESVLESSDIVGNIRFSYPTLYIFPAGQGDAALFGINGFNMLVDGGFSRKACFWNFVRHLDRLDAVLLTRINNNNVGGIGSMMRRKRHSSVYPQIGHFFCNILERKSILSPDGDKDKDPLLVNLFEEGQELVENLHHINLNPQTCYRDVEPINLYHKVGHGTLDMYVLSPTRESKEVREFLQKWNSNDQKLFASQKHSRDFNFPVQNLVSICAVLVWQPANINDNITRILFPGSAPQQKVFEGLDKLKQLEFFKYPTCSLKSLAPIPKAKHTKGSVIERLLQEQKQEKQERQKEKMAQQIGKIDGKVEEVKPTERNGVTTEQKTIRKHDSTESEKSLSKSTDTRKAEEVNGKVPEDKPPTKPKTKPDSKPKVDAKPKVEPKPAKQPPKKPKSTLTDRKPSPKKVVEPKENGEIKDKEISPKTRVVSRSSPATAPAKSAKDANNRKVAESKKATPAKDTPKPEKKEAPERKPISRRTKGLSSAAKLPGSPQKKLEKKVKLEKEGTTDSSTVSTPSADQEFKKDISKLTPEELEALKARELADLQEEQEVIKEIEAVFLKSEQAEKEMRRIKNISIEDHTDEEYLIIEKEEIEHEMAAEQSLKEGETQKHIRDSEESEKLRASLEGQKAPDDVPHAVQQQKLIPTKDEIAPTEEKLEGDKEILDKKVEDEKETADLKSQPEDKFSTPIESGATTAPTLPEDERMPLEEIKEAVIEEKHTKEETKEKDKIDSTKKVVEPVVKTTVVASIKLDRQSQIRDIVKTPDEVADLPVHEEADIDTFEQFHEKDDLKEEADQKVSDIKVKEEKIVESDKDKVASKTDLKQDEKDKFHFDDKTEPQQETVPKTAKDIKEEINQIEGKLIPEPSVVENEILKDEHLVKEEEQHLEEKISKQLEDAKKPTEQAQVTESKDEKEQKVKQVEDVAMKKLTEEELKKDMHPKEKGEKDDVTPVKEEKEKLIVLDKETKEEAKEKEEKDKEQLVVESIIEDQNIEYKISKEAQEIKVDESATKDEIKAKESPQKEIKATEIDTKLHTGEKLDLKDDKADLKTTTEKLDDTGKPTDEEKQLPQVDTTKDILEKREDEKHFGVKEHKTEKKDELHAQDEKVQEHDVVESVHKHVEVGSKPQKEESKKDEKLKVDDKDILERKLSMSEEVHKDERKLSVTEEIHTDERKPSVSEEIHKEERKPSVTEEIHKDEVKVDSKKEITKEKEYLLSPTKPEKIRDEHKEEIEKKATRTAEISPKEKDKSVLEEDKEDIKHYETIPELTEKGIKEEKDFEIAEKAEIHEKYQPKETKKEDIVGQVLLKDHEKPEKLEDLKVENATDEFLKQEIEMIQQEAPRKLSTEEIQIKKDSERKVSLEVEDTDKKPEKISETDTDKMTESKVSEHKEQETEKKGETKKTDKKEQEMLEPSILKDDPKKVDTPHEKEEKAAIYETGDKKDVKSPEDDNKTLDKELEQIKATIDKFDAIEKSAHEEKTKEKDEKHDILNKTIDLKIEKEVNDTLQKIVGIDSNKQDENRLVGQIKEEIAEIHDIKVKGGETPALKDELEKAEHKSEDKSKEEMFLIKEKESKTVEDIKDDKDKASEKEIADFKEISTTKEEKKEMPKDTNKLEENKISQHDLSTSITEEKIQKPGDNKDEDEEIDISEEETDIKHKEELHVEKSDKEKDVIQGDHEHELPKDGKKETDKSQVDLKEIGHLELVADKNVTKQAIEDTRYKDKKPESPESLTEHKKCDASSLSSDGSDEKKEEDDITKLLYSKTSISPVTTTPEKRESKGEIRAIDTDPIKLEHEVISIDTIKLEKEAHSLIKEQDKKFDEIEDKKEDISKLMKKDHSPTTEHDDQLKKLDIHKYTPKLEEKYDSPPKEPAKESEKHDEKIDDKHEDVSKFEKKVDSPPQEPTKGSEKHEEKIHDKHEDVTKLEKKVDSPTQEQVKKSEKHDEKFDDKHEDISKLEKKVDSLLQEPAKEAEKHDEKIDDKHEDISKLEKKIDSLTQEPTQESKKHEEKFDDKHEDFYKFEKKVDSPPQEPIKESEKHEEKIDDKHEDVSKLEKKVDSLPQELAKESEKHEKKIDDKHEDVSKFEKKVDSPPQEPTKGSEKHEEKIHDKHEDVTKLEKKVDSPTQEQVKKSEKHDEKFDDKHEDISKLEKKVDSLLHEPAKEAEKHDEKIDDKHEDVSKLEKKVDSLPQELAKESEKHEKKIDDKHEDVSKFEKKVDSPPQEPTKGSEKHEEKIHDKHEDVTKLEKKVDSPTQEQVKKSEKHDEKFDDKHEDISKLEKKVDSLLHEPAKEAEKHDEKIDDKHEDVSKLEKKVDSLPQELAKESEKHEKKIDDKHEDVSKFEKKVDSPPQEPAKESEKHEKDIDDKHEDVSKLKKIVDTPPQEPTKESEKQDEKFDDKHEDISKLETKVDSPLQEPTKESEKHEKDIDDKHEDVSKLKKIVDSPPQDPTKESEKQDEKFDDKHEDISKLEKKFDSPPQEPTKESEKHEDISKLEKKVDSPPQEPTKESEKHEEKIDDKHEDISILEKKIDSPPQEPIKETEKHEEKIHDKHEDVSKLEMKIDSLPQEPTKKSEKHDEKFDDKHEDVSKLEKKVDSLLQEPTKETEKHEEKIHDKHEDVFKLEKKIDSLPQEPTKKSEKHDEKFDDKHEDVSKLEKKVDSLLQEPTKESEKHEEKIDDKHEDIPKLEKKGDLPTKEQDLIVENFKDKIEDKLDDISNLEKELDLLVKEQDQKVEKLQDKIKDKYVEITTLKQEKIISDEVEQEKHTPSQEESVDEKLKGYALGVRDKTKITEPQQEIIITKEDYHHESQTIDAGHIDDAIFVTKEEIKKELPLFAEKVVVKDDDDKLMGSTKEGKLTLDIDLHKGKSDQKSPEVKVVSPTPPIEEKETIKQDFVEETMKSIDLDKKDTEEETTETRKTEVDDKQKEEPKLTSKDELEKHLETLTKETTETLISEVTKSHDLKDAHDIFQKEEIEEEKKPEKDDKLVTLKDDQQKQVSPEKSKNIEQTIVDIKESKETEKKHSTIEKKIDIQKDDEFIKGKKSPTEVDTIVIPEKTDKTTGVKETDSKKTDSDIISVLKESEGQESDKILEQEPEKLDLTIKPEVPKIDKKDEKQVDLEKETVDKLESIDKGKPEMKTDKDKKEESSPDLSETETTSKESEIVVVKDEKGHEGINTKRLPTSEVIESEIKTKEIEQKEEKYSPEKHKVTEPIQKDISKVVVKDETIEKVLEKGIREIVAKSPEYVVAETKEKDTRQVLDNETVADIHKHVDDKEKSDIAKIEKEIEEEKPATIEEITIHTIEHVETKDVDSIITPTKLDSKDLTQKLIENERAVSPVSDSIHHETVAKDEEISTTIESKIYDAKTADTKVPTSQDLKELEVEIHKGESDMKTRKKDLEDIAKIDSQLQKMKTTILDETKEKHESLITDTPKLLDETFDKKELGCKSPKEREEDVFKIVASVAEVLKSDAPLEEFRGKIPIDIDIEPATESFITELRETHITGPPLSESVHIEEEEEEENEREIEKESIGDRIFEGVETIMKGIGGVISTTLFDETPSVDKPKTEEFHSDISKKEETVDEVSDHSQKEDEKSKEVSPIKSKDHSPDKETDGHSRKKSLSESFIEGIEKIASDIGHTIETKVFHEKSIHSEHEKLQEHPISKSTEFKEEFKKPELDDTDKETKEMSSPHEHCPISKEHEKKMSITEHIIQGIEKVGHSIESKLLHESHHTDKKESIVHEHDILKSIETKEESPLDHKKTKDDEINKDLMHDEHKIKEKHADGTHERKKSISEKIIDGIEKYISDIGHIGESKAPHHAQIESELKKSELSDVFGEKAAKEDTHPLHGKQETVLKISSEMSRTLDSKDSSPSDSQDSIREKQEMTEEHKTHKKKQSLTESIIGGIEKVASGIGHTIETKIFHETDATIEQKLEDAMREDYDFEHHKETAASKITEIKTEEKSLSKENETKLEHDKMDYKESSQTEKHHKTISETIGKIASSITSTIEAKFNGFDTSESKHEQLAETKSDHVKIDSLSHEIHRGATDIKSEKITTEEKKTTGVKEDKEEHLSETKETETETAKESKLDKHTSEFVTEGVEKVVSDGKKLIDESSTKLSETFSGIREKIESESKHVSEGLMGLVEQKSEFVEKLVSESKRAHANESKEIVSTKTTTETIKYDQQQRDETKSLDSKDIKSSISTFLETEKLTTMSEPEKVTVTKIETTIAGPSGKMTESIIISTSAHHKDELTWSGKSTPDIAELESVQDVSDLKASIEVRGDSTPPTVPVSPIVKEEGISQTVSSVKVTDLRSSTPASDDLEQSDLSSSQFSKVIWESDKQNLSDDDDLPGTPLSTTSQVAASSSSHDLEDDSVKLMSKFDPMSMSLYGALPEDSKEDDMKSSRVLDEADLDFDKAMKDDRGDYLFGSSSPSYMYEVTTAKYTVMSEAGKSSDGRSQDLMTSSFIGELPKETHPQSSEGDKDKVDDVVKSWGKPLGLPSPAPLNDNKGTPKKERKIPPNVLAKNKLNEDKKMMDSKKSKKCTPVYVDLTYVPHFGNSNYCAVDFFRRVRARYYVFSGLEPSKDVYNALLEAKQTWEDKDLEVTIIPTYDTDVLGYWAAENEDLLAKHKIDFSPSASRCTINLQDHETSCSAYRLEFS